MPDPIIRRFVVKSMAGASPEKFKFNQFATQLELLLSIITPPSAILDEGFQNWEGFPNRWKQQEPQRKCPPRSFQ